MDLGLGNALLPGDSRLIDHIVGEVKSQGIFDQFRKDALADVDTKPAYQNLRTRVESSVNSFLAKQTWKADLNKNQLRETLRKHISVAPYLDAGVERIVDQVVNPKIYSVFMPQIEDVVYKYLGLEKPKREENGACNLKDLLPIDLDPVSPESDKNSLKDVSLDSVDTNISITDDKEKDTFEMADLNEVSKVENENDNDKINNDRSEDMMKSIDEDKGPSSTSPLADTNLNDSGKSDDKMEEEEEDSPVFEPIDIMNLQEFHMSNDSHLSGISELTSHRSCSPDCTNEFSRDNFDFSNQDSQFSKVSSNSRLSIVTDFGSSNQASTPVSDLPKEENNKDKYIKDNFQAIRGESCAQKDANPPINTSNKKSILSETKDEIKSSKYISTSKESSRDGMDNSSKDKTDHKEKSRESTKSKSSKERSDSRNSKSYKDRDKDSKAKSNTGEIKNESSEKLKIKDKPDIIRDDKNKDAAAVLKEEKPKDSSSKEAKDLKDIYKEKIRELREKKELTEKEKLNKDPKTTKDPKEKRDSSKDKKDNRSSSTKSHSSVPHSSKSKSTTKDDSKSSRSSSKDATKREDGKSTKERKSSSRSESDKSDGKRVSRIEKDEKSSQKSTSSNKKERRSDSNSKSSDRSEIKRESEKSESKRESDKNKKRREDKKSKSKDDHSSSKKNSNDRRSSDRDGSNGSNGKSADTSNSSSSNLSAKSASSSLTKESNNTSNSNSEASDDVDESQTENSNNSNIETTKSMTVPLNAGDEDTKKDTNIKKIDLGQNEISLPLKKRPLNTLEDISSQVPIKKPKFARNFQEAKKLMKLRKKLDKKHQAELLEERTQSPLLIVPDNKRVQIIEFPVDSDDELDSNGDGSTGKQAILILEQEPDEKSDTKSNEFNCKSKLSEMELAIRKSLDEMMTGQSLKEELNKENTCDTYGGDQDEAESVKIVDEDHSLEPPGSSDDEELCRYFVEDNERLIRFNKFLQSLGIEEHSSDLTKQKRHDSVKPSETKTMAPPQPKRKYSTSPLSDILLNNSNNNNDGHKIIPAISEEECATKKKRIGRTKKPGTSASLSSQQSIINGENFVMPLSPDSDVSATSDKLISQLIRDEKSRPRSNQHYTSDDLYKPRPLFVGSSRRNRRLNQA